MPPRVFLQLAALTCVICKNIVVAQVPRTTVWPKKIILKEEPIPYSPVSGSVLLGIMYGGDQVSSDSFSTLVPAGTDTLCLNITTRDGSYIGRGSIRAQFSKTTTLKGILSGTLFSSLIRQEAVAALSVWPSRQGECSDEGSRHYFLPTSWNSDARPVELTFLVNSSGYSARMLFVAGQPRRTTVHSCEYLPSVTRSRVYDSACKVKLCTLVNTEELWLEITNFGRRVHLERISLPPLSSYCKSR